MSLYLNSSYWVLWLLVECVIVVVLWVCGLFRRSFVAFVKCRMACSFVSVFCMYLTMAVARCWLVILSPVIEFDFEAEVD